MPATVSADLSRLGQGARLHAGKVFRRKDLAASLPSVDRELGRALMASASQSPMRPAIHRKAYSVPATVLAMEAGTAQVEK